MIRFILPIIITVFITTSVDAQLFKRLSDRVADKLEKKVEDKIVEELSEEIANRAMRPLDKAFDDMFRAKYKEQYGEEYDDSQYEGDPEARNAAMQAMMASMFGDVDLPESFSFNYSIDIETYDYGAKKPNKARMLINTTDDVFAMTQIDGSEENTIVFANGGNNMYLFNEKDKTLMSMAGMMGFAASIANAQVDKELDKEVTIEKTGKSKKIQGYNADQYKIESEEDKGEIYLSTNLPFDWKDSFGGMIEQLSPQFYEKHPEYDLSGMVLEAKSKRKKDNKESKWITKDISQKSTVIKTSEYKNALAVD